MLHAIRHKVVVQPGGVIEIRSPELPDGATAEVIVILDALTAPPVRLTQLMGKAKGGFNNPAEVDEFIQRERDSWDS